MTAKAKVTRTIFTDLYQVRALIRDYGYVRCVLVANGKGDAAERVRIYYREHSLTVLRIVDVIRCEYGVLEIA